MTQIRSVTCLCSILTPQTCGVHTDSQLFYELVYFSSELAWRKFNLFLILFLKIDRALGVKQQSIPTFDIAMAEG